MMHSLTHCILSTLVESDIWSMGFSESAIDQLHCNVYRAMLCDAVKMSVPITGYSDINIKHLQKNKAREN